VKNVRITLAGLLAVGGITLISQGSVSAATPDEWEQTTAHPAACYQHGPFEQNQHGNADDTTVVLHEFNQSWPGDHWELLVINSTAVSNGTADTVIDHPQAGVDYIGDNGGTINYWIVCKGTTPYTPNPQHSVVVDCGKATLTLSNPEEYGQPGEDYTFTYTVDGVEKQVTVAPGGTETIDELFPEDSGTHTVSIDGVDYTVDTNCEDDSTTPAEPSFVDPTCAEPSADVDATDTDEYTYSIVGTVAPGGTVTVTATATAGHVLDGVSEWTHTFPSLGDLDCTVDANPVASIETECGAATLTFSNLVDEVDDGYSADDHTFTYTVDGVDHQITVAPGDTETVELTFGEDTGLHSVDIGQGAFTIESDCLQSGGPEPKIDVAAFSPVCQSDTPYISYNIAVSGTPNTTADITFIDNEGDVVASYTDMPFTGTVIYPGASPAPNQDWPGWKLQPNGLWVWDETDANWRDGLTVQVEVNPTATALVSYPDPSSACDDPPQVASQAPPAQPSQGVQLPSTGSSTGTMTILGLLMLAGGAVLVATARRTRRV
jgi:LPXTG-motif cell wall-anchored protein